MLASVLGLALAAVAGGLFMLLRRMHATAVELAAATRLRDAAQDAEQATMRHVRLAAHDLRGIGMSLHGHADHLIASQHDHASDIAAAAADLLDMADDLQDYGVHVGDARMLREEQIELAMAVTEAVAAVSLAIAPGRRNWRITGELESISLYFDPRALRHMLSRVLADTIRNTRQDDWIDVSLDDGGQGLAVVIADEGAGNAWPEPGRTGPGDSRGIGLRLTLARSLMAAHGGRVEVEARVGVGTRVSLIFPPGRVQRVAAAHRFAA